MGVNGTQPAARDQAPLVVITDSDLPSAGAEEACLEAAGLRVLRGACRTEDEVIALAASAEALLVQWAPVTARVLDALPRLRLISRIGIGYDMIDVAAASARGVAVANTPDYCVEEVCAHTLALILSFARGLVPYDRSLRAGEWAATRAYPGACRPSDETVAVVGFGRIGSRVAAQLRALGFGVLACDPFADPEAIRAAGAEPAVLDDALARARFVTLHAPLSEATRGLIGRDALARMRADAVLVNTCRGPLVDEAALAEALCAGAIAGAALDVFEQEPLPASSRLRELDNVLLTPHAAWYSPAALRDLPRLAAEQVVAFFAGRPLPNLVSDPASVAANPAAVTTSN